MIRLCDSNSSASAVAAAAGEANVRPPPGLSLSPLSRAAIYSQRTRQDSQRSAAVLACSKRTEAVVARWGGDEFGILMRGCDEQARRMVEDLYEALAAARVASSIGWAPITVLREASRGLADADQAMYDAKRPGGQAP